MQVRGIGWVASASALLAFAGSATAQQALFTSNGAAGDHYGWDVASAGDVDLDGVEDLAVGTRAGYVSVRSGADHAQLVLMNGSAADWFGRFVAPAGDVDGDGVSELLVGASQSGAGGAGAVEVRSGASGVAILTLTPGADGDQVGSAICGLGDVDLDGVPDFALGAKQAAPNGNASGSLWLISGASGQTLHRVDGGAAGELLGKAVAAAGDVDQDGRPDVVVGLPGFGGHGRVEVRSGLDAQPIRFGQHGALGAQLGTFVAGGRDLDGDGVPEFAAGAEFDDTAALNAGRVTVWSGADSSVRMDVLGTTAAERLGRVRLLPDFDGDGRDDVCLSALLADPGGLDAAGRADVRSGRTGEVVHSVGGASAKAHLGVVAETGDLDGDGRAELVVSSRDASVGAGQDHGRLDVFPGTSVAWQLVGCDVSLQDGGARELVINEDPSEAGTPYLVLGSVTGTDEVLDLGVDLFVPLTPDPYFLFTLTHANAAPLLGSFGALDEHGVGVAQLVVPPDSNAAFAGLDVHHAYVLFGESYAKSASGAVTLTLQP